MDVVALFILNTETSELMQPGNGALDNPAETPNPLPCAIFRCASTGSMPLTRNC